jgi:hypothetical protein
MQWTLVALVGLLIAAAIFYFGRDTRATGGASSPAATTFATSDAISAGSASTTAA